ncbi:2-carboxy-1,4-naphthoquinone phytyltransferase [Synechococcus sp. H70.2]|uniref:2-carboxy-1,4-naphthoquinone phytyltransferase n=1 Tax=unclassified Synechococcus TaxID=2626047 RepID=UPI0039C2194C
MAALKPPMYSVAIMPIWVGSAIAYAQVGVMDVGVLLVFLGAAICLLAWVNISNDVFDAQTGVDKNKLHSLVNLTGRPEQVFWAGNAFLALGLAGILWLSWRQADPTVLLLVLLACGLGYAYQGPPLRLGYQGLGEILCFLSFGPLAVLAAHYSQSQTWSLPALAASLVVGMATSLILFCSHFHQVEDDLAAGKRSPVVRLGTRRAARLIPWICGSIFGLLLLFVGLGTFPAWTLLGFAGIPFAVRLSRLLGTYYDQPQRISHSKFIAVGLHFCLGLFLGLGFILSRLG